MFSRRFFNFIAIVVLLVSGCARVVKVPQTKCVPSSQVYKKGTGIIIWDFEVESTASMPSDLGSCLSDKIALHLLKEGHYRVVDRGKILLILEQLKLGISDLTNEKTRLRIAKIVGAKLMVGGHVIQMAGNYTQIKLQLVETETRKFSSVKKVYNPALLEMSEWQKAIENMIPELFQICS